MTFTVIQIGYILAKQSKILNKETAVVENLGHCARFSFQEHDVVMLLSGFLEVLTIDALCSRRQ